MKTISMKDFKGLYDKNPDLNILDVRMPIEYKGGHIPGAKSLPLNQLPGDLSTDESYYVICQSGSRSDLASQILSAQGFDVTNVESGMAAWEDDVQWVLYMTIK